MKAWPLILGLAVLAGCARFQSQPLVPEKTAAQLDARRLDDPGLQKFLKANLDHPPAEWPPADWDLEELTLVAFYYHPTLEVARTQWLVASAGLETAGRRPNPSVTVTPGYDDSRYLGSFNPWVVPVTFDLPIETAGKRAKRMAEAVSVSESARLSFVRAAWQIRSGVRASLLDFTFAGRRAALLAQQFDSQNDALKLLQARFDAGEIARPELAVARIALDKTRLDLNDAESKKIAARSHLAGALGLSGAALDGVNFETGFSPPDLGPLTSAAARQIALRTRADILAALADYAAAEADLRLQVAKQYPDLHLGPGYGWNASNAGDSLWSLGLTLELPIFDQNQGPIAEAVAHRKLAAAKFIELQSQVIGEIDRAIAGLDVANRQLQLLEQLRLAEAQQQQSAEAQYQAGAGERLDLLNAQMESGSAALVRLEGESNYQSALAALEDALQRPAGSISVAIEKLSTENPQAKESQP